MDKVTVTYLGPSGARHLVRLGIVAERGVPVEIPTEYAAELAGNPCWKIGAASPAKAKSAGAEKE